MVKINLNISNKSIYLIAAIASLLLVSGIAIAYTLDGSGTPSTMGHSLDELEIPTCTDGEILEYSGGSLVCGTDNIGSGTDTTCATSGTCNQVCIGGNCKTDWPVVAIPTCVYNNNIHSVGAICKMNTDCKLCISTGWTSCSVGTNPPTINC
jgi:hypothetical protein